MLEEYNTEINCKNRIVVSDNYQDVLLRYHRIIQAQLIMMNG